MFGCFLGDPQMGKWPWLDPLTIADDAAVRWLPLLAVHGRPTNRRSSPS